MERLPPLARVPEHPAHIGAGSQSVGDELGSGRRNGVLQGSPEKQRESGQAPVDRRVAAALRDEAGDRQQSTPQRSSPVPSSASKTQRLAPASNATTSTRIRPGILPRIIAPRHRQMSNSRANVLSSAQVRENTTLRTATSIARNWPGRFVAAARAHQLRRDAPARGPAVDPGWRPRGRHSMGRMAALPADRPGGAGGGRSALRYATRSSNSWTVSVSLNDGIFEEPSAAS